MQYSYLIIMFIITAIIPLKPFSFPTNMPGNYEFKNGVFSDKSLINFRIGYIYDNIYKEEINDSSEDNSSEIKVKTNGGIFILNIKNQWDLYGFIGESKINLDDEINTKYHFSFAAGTKIHLLTYKNFGLFLDAKYFKASPEMNYLLVNGAIYPTRSETYKLLYEEYQGSLGISCKIGILLPYIAINYLYAECKPEPSNIIHMWHPFPNQNSEGKATLPNYRNINNWGATLGIGILSKDKISLNLETKLINCFEMSLSSEIRF